MIEEQVKARIIKASKEKNAVVRDLLRTLVGEVERENGGHKECETDEVWINVIKKMIKGIDVSLEVIQDETNRKILYVNLLLEKEILQQFLPQTLSKSEILDIIKNQNLNVSSSVGTGRSIGNVIKFLKSENENFVNEDVKLVVESILSQS